VDCAQSYRAAQGDRRGFERTDAERRMELSMGAEGIVDVAGLTCHREAVF